MPEVPMRNAPEQWLYRNRCRLARPSYPLKVARRRARYLRIKARVIRARASFLMDLMTAVSEVAMSDLYRAWREPTVEE